MLRLLAFLGLITAAPSSSHAGSVDDLVAEVEVIQNESGMRSASIGFYLIPVDGEPGGAAGFHMDTGLIPASTLKAITTATANEILGSDFRFRTELQITGTPSDEGILNGNIVIRGGGDPTLGDSGSGRVFAKWKSALTKAGIQKVEGFVVGDASIFGTKRLSDSWQWNDIGNYYGAGACGLTFHENQFSCRFRTASPGSKASFLGTDPKLPGIEFINEMRVGPTGSGDQGYIYGVPYGKIFYLRGTVPAGSSSFTIRGALPDPAFFCARALTKYLNESDLSVSGEATTVRLLALRGKPISARKVLLKEESETLGSLLILTNHKSINLRAECIHRMIGLKVRGKGTTRDAAGAIKDYWAEKGVDMTGFYMADGCGLSRANTVSARQMAMILYHAAKEKGFETFYRSLPVAGRSGTLRSIGRGTSAEGRVHAKSGTLDRIKDYAGYINARSGKRYAFAIFINNYSGSLSSVKSKIVRVWEKMVAL